jgi:hypothetical protein
MRSLATDSSRRRCEIERGARAPNCPDHRHLTDSSDTLAIRKCLGGPDVERCYGDGPPHWRQGRGNRPAMTSDEARAQRRRDVKMLRRHGKGDPQALALADDIAACRPGRRCGCAGCMECRRATQRLFVDAGDRLLRRSSINVLAVSVVLRGAGAFEGDLSLEPDVFGRLSRQIARALRRREFGRRSAASTSRQTSTTRATSPRTTGRTPTCSSRRASSRAARPPSASSFQSARPSAVPSWQRLSMVAGEAWRTR